MQRGRHLPHRAVADRQNNKIDSVVYVGHFHIDYFAAVANNQAGRLEYDNPLCSCLACNLLKSDQSIPDPLHVFTSATVIVRSDGVIRGKTKAARKLIDLLQLNSASYRQRRRLMLALLRAVRKDYREIYVELMRFPDDLPDLVRLVPPGGNARPAGIRQSFHALRLAGKLPRVY
jgi:hypothetical protein